MATIGDIVLVYQEEHPAFFARIEGIWADKKPDWYHVKLLILQVPVVEAVWILRDVYINGETFTMNGIRLRLEKIRGSETAESSTAAPEASSTGSPAEGGEENVISLFDRKKGGSNF